jgi:hypothetical protein
MLLGDFGHALVEQLGREYALVFGAFTYDGGHLIENDHGYVCRVYVIERLLL